MLPRICFRTAVTASVLAVSVEFLHHLVYVDSKAMLCAAADVCQEVGQVRSELIAFNQALPHALTYACLDLSVRQLSNRVDPE